MLSNAISLECENMYNFLLQSDKEMDLHLGHVDANIAVGGMVIIYTGNVSVRRKRKIDTSADIGSNKKVSDHYIV